MCAGFNNSAGLFKAVSDRLQRFLSRHCETFGKIPGFFPDFSVIPTRAVDGFRDAYIKYAQVSAIGPGDDTRSGGFLQAGTGHLTGNVSGTGADAMRGKSVIGTHDQNVFAGYVVPQMSGHSSQPDTDILQKPETPPGFYECILVVTCQETLLNVKCMLPDLILDLFQIHCVGGF